MDLGNEGLSGWLSFKMFCWFVTMRQTVAIYNMNTEEAQVGFTSILERDGL